MKLFQPHRETNKETLYKKVNLRDVYGDSSSQCKYFDIRKDH